MSVATLITSNPLSVNAIIWSLMTSRHSFKVISAGKRPSESTLYEPFVTACNATLTRLRLLNDIPGLRTPCRLGIKFYKSGGHVHGEFSPARTVRKPGLVIISSRAHDRLSHKLGSSKCGESSQSKLSKAVDSPSPSAGPAPTDPLKLEWQICLSAGDMKVGTRNSAAPGVYEFCDTVQDSEPHSTFQSISAMAGEFIN